MEEPVVMAPAPMMPSTDWTGPYVGGQLGWGWISGDSNLDGSDFGFDGDVDADFDGNGVIGGFTAGYRYDFGQFVAGGEVQYDWAHNEFDELDINTTDIDAQIDLEEEAGSLDSIWRVKGIAGYDLGRTLIYGSAGYAHASGEVGGDDADADGWLVGAGADYMIRDNVTIGGELMYHQFSDFGFKGSDLDATTFQAKVTYRF